MADDNWDLQAVVRGYGGVKPAAVGGDPLSSFDSSSSSSSSSSCPSLLLHENRVVAEENLLFCFQDLLARPTALQELQDLCKPFFPKSSLPPLQQQQQQQKQNLLLPNSPMPQPLLPLTPPSKKRKSQQKKVVCQVPAGGHSDDMWAWRKYGQKPIKGSPFPRGYYRCSSSKSCIARKQVERSKTDPSVFVVTYTGEHNHPLPTHRNSLAGSTRHKLPSSSSTTTTTSQQAHMVTAAAGLSPTTSLAASTEEEEEEEEEEDYCDEDLLLASDMEMLDEDSMMFLG